MAGRFPEHAAYRDGLVFFANKWCSMVLKHLVSMTSLTHSAFLRGKLCATTRFFPPPRHLSNFSLTTLPVPVNGLFLSISRTCVSSNQLKRKSVFSAECVYKCCRDDEAAIASGTACGATAADRKGARTNPESSMQSMGDTEEKLDAFYQQTGGFIYERRARFSPFIFLSNLIVVARETLTFWYIIFFTVLLLLYYFAVQLGH